MLDNSVCVETDYFFDFVTTPVDPSTPAAREQNEAIISAYCQAARVYTEAGYHVILEGVIGPWILPLITRQIGNYHYFLLHTELSTALSRVDRRTSKTVSASMVKRMHPQFDAVLTDYADSVVSTEALGAGDVASSIYATVTSAQAEVGFSHT